MATSSIEKIKGAAYLFRQRLKPSQHVMLTAASSQQIETEMVPSTLRQDVFNLVCCTLTHWSKRETSLTLVTNTLTILYNYKWTETFCRL